jgi:disulfide bond formation protein DsbB
MMLSGSRVILAIATLAVGAVLLAAHASEWWGGLIPCALCLVERWPYRIGLGVGALGLLLPGRFLRGAMGLFVAVMLAGMAAGVVHVGVEWKYWPSPLPECRGPDLRGMTLAQRLAAMPERPSKPCDEPAFLFEAIPVSMAEMNLLFSLGNAGFVLAGLWLRRRDPA